jgi:hypothetical protein
MILDANLLWEYLETIAENAPVLDVDVKERELINNLQSLRLIQYVECSDMISITDGLPVYGWILTGKGFEFLEGKEVKIND